LANDLSRLLQSQRLRSPKTAISKEYLRNQRPERQRHKYTAHSRRHGHYAASEWRDFQLLLLLVRMAEVDGDEAGWGEMRCRLDLPARRPVVHC